MDKVCLQDATGMINPESGFSNSGFSGDKDKKL